MEEFHQRRREAVANKARGGAQLKGPLFPRPAPPPSSQPPPPPRPQLEARNKAEQVSHSVGKSWLAASPLLPHLQEYLARLQAIRKQNFLERRRIQQQVESCSSPHHPALDPEARRRKIAALKAQADLEAEKMRQRIVEKQRERVAAQQQQDKEKEDEREDKHVAAGPGSESSPTIVEQPVRGRPQWAASPEVALGFACQPEATGRVTVNGKLMSTGVLEL